MNFFRRRDEPVIVVSGLPRSGTSLMMQMLEAGGVPILADAHRPPDASNPLGYYEFAPVKRLHTGDTTWLSGARGKAVKVVSALLTALPTEYTYRVIFMDRALDEVIRSQHAMLARLDQPLDGFNADKLRDDTARHLAAVEAWLRAQRHVATLRVSYAGLIRDPSAGASQVSAFLGLELDAAAMSRAVDPALYRERQID